MKKVLTIAGSDCSGGAGVQADLKTMAAHGVFGMSVIVSVVAENTMRVLDIQDISPAMIEAQIDAVFEDIVPDAVKIGMLSSPACMRAVAGKLAQYRPPHIVVDPVMFAKNGDPLMDPASIGTLVDCVLPYAEVVTPNIPEAQYIAGMTIETVEDMEQAARRIHAKGCRNVLVKGGQHIADAVDVMFDGQTCRRYTIRQLDTKNTHGTGCTLSSAIASDLALGLDVPEAVERAKAYVTGAIAHAPGLGHGCGPLGHFYRTHPEGGDPV
ncbi:MAG: bifunctional hydroxymethylpyrimidine kinase/phosphomethylpyrimidine kinase [Eubacteriales bacterium]|nr:bifunctional hydroxymethylpyrimidine kinase/phosphomethylpyrimidine kinase [Eubacteriales bacterium]